MFLDHPALDTADARRFIDRVADAGVDQLVFTGGDPLQRADIVALAQHASGAGLRVEIQTNAQQALAASIISRLEEVVDVWGLSIDSADESVHDQVRGRPGNFRRVRAAASSLARMDTEWNLRTLVSRPTIDSFSSLGEWLLGLGFRHKWYLLQFTALGDEIANRRDFEISDHEFEVRASLTVDRYRESGFQTIPVPEKERRGIYFLVAPDGSVYNQPPPGTPYTVVGNALMDDFSELEERLVIDYVRHERRYGAPRSVATA